MRMFRSQQFALLFEDGLVQRLRFAEARQIPQYVRHVEAEPKQLHLERLSQCRLGFSGQHLHPSRLDFFPPSTPAFQVAALPQISHSLDKQLANVLLLGPHCPRWPQMWPDESIAIPGVRIIYLALGAGRSQDLMSA